MRALLRSSDHFAVPAAYILYLGDPPQRPELTCRAHEEPTCNRCERASVSVLPGLAALAALTTASPAHPHELAQDAYRASVPLEDLVGPVDERVVDLNWRVLDRSLRVFLSEPQSGARAVAKRVFAIVAEIRMHAFRAAVPWRPIAHGIFNELPDDAGHFGTPYYPHILRGLRRTLPADVADVLGGGSGHGLSTSGLRGVVLVQL